MLVLEILLIMIGLFAVILSYRLVDKQEMTKERENVTVVDNNAETARTELEQWKEQLSAAGQESLEDIKNRLETISNDKIMGINEYSSQVLDKIEKNHGEVVFLYDMLIQKDEEIKELIHRVDLIKAQFHEEFNREYQAMKEKMQTDLSRDQDKLEELQRELVKKQNEWLEAFEIRAENSTLSEEFSEKTSMTEIFDEEINQIIRQEEQADGLPETQEQTRQEEDDNMIEENHNTQIIRLYKQGLSVLEISRMLSLGQGEVKFVIDLNRKH